MKKTYIIPTTEVVEIKTKQLVMTSTMSVYSTDELENSEDILSRKNLDWFDDEEDY